MANYVNTYINLIHQDDSPQIKELFKVLGEIGICEYYWSKHQEELESSGLSRSDYTSDFNTEVSSGMWGSYISFESKWTPIHPRFIELLHRDIGDFDYEWEEEQSFGQAYRCVNGSMNLQEEWDIPQWEEIELPTGDYLHLLLEPWRDIPQGYYADSYTDLDYFYSRHLDEAIQMHTEHNNV